jgi:transcription antitermination protein NusB
VTQQNDPKTGPTAASKAAAPARDRTKSPRRRARELALQCLYDWQINPRELADIEAHLREVEPFGKVDALHFDALLQGCVAQREALDAALSQFLDRPMAELSPIEHAVMWVGAYELTHCMDVPYKVAINEAVELAKTFGGTDGHKYVNGVLDQLAPLIRPEEVKAKRAQR